MLTVISHEHGAPDFEENNVKPTGTITRYELICGSQFSTLIEQNQDIPVYIVRSEI